MACRVVLPTSSMSRVRTHFCTSATRRHGGVCWPSRYGLNGCMPAMTNSTRGVIGDQAGRRHDGVPLLLEVGKEAAGDLCRLHQWPSLGSKFVSVLS